MTSSIVGDSWSFLYLPSIGFPGQYDIKKLKCRQGNACKKLCNSGNCKLDIIVCDEKACKCREDHLVKAQGQEIFKKCDFTKASKILDQIAERKNRQIQEFNELKRTLNELIQTLGRLQKSIPFIGLKQVELDFLSMVKCGEAKLSSKEIREIINIHFSNPKIDPEWLNEIFISLKKDQGCGLDSIKAKFLDFEKSINSHVKLTNEKEQEGLSKQLINLEDLDESRISKKTTTSELGQSLMLDFMHQQSSISSVNFGIDSTVTNNNQHLKWIGKCLEPYKINFIKLLYRASESDFSIKKFHQKCDKKKNTLLLLKSDNDKVIGAFTQSEWSSPKKDTPQFDRNSFLLVFDQDNKNSKFLIKHKDRQSIVNRQDTGPYYGHGELSVCNKSNVVRDSFAFKASTLDSMLGRQDKYKNVRRTYTGKDDGKFKTKEWEMHQVIFQQSSLKMQGSYIQKNLKPTNNPNK